MNNDIIQQKDYLYLKEKKFLEHKLLTNDLISKLKVTGFRRQADTVTSCGDFLEFRLFRHKENKTEKQKLSGANFCKFRFCPYCNWRKTRNIAGQLKEALGTINEKNEYSFLFLTLTVKNPQIENIKETVKHMNKSFNKLMKISEVKNIVKGYFKSIELIGSKTKKGQAHPHFHILLIVKKSFSNGKNYITQKKWTDFWQNCLGVDYSPMVDIRKIKSKNENWNDIDSAIVETVKYSVKHTELTKMANDDFYHLVTQSFNMRFYSTGGILKEHLNIKKAEEDLINFKEETEALWIEICKLLYKFENGEYILKKIENPGLIDYEKKKEEKPVSLKRDRIKLTYQKKIKNENIPIIIDGVKQVKKIKLPYNKWDTYELLRYYEKIDFETFNKQEFVVIHNELVKRKAIKQEKLNINDYAFLNSNPF